MSDHPIEGMMNTTLEKIKQMGVKGVITMSDTSVQIIIGSEVHQIMAEIEQIL